MTRCVFENDAGESVAVKVETHEVSEDFPTGGVSVHMQSGTIKEIESALDRKEAEVLLHVLAHKLGYTLIDSRKAKMLPPGISSPRSRRRSFIG
jgi:hypothetical protein